MNHKTKTALRFGVSALIVLLGGCSVEQAGTNVDDKPGLVYDTFHINGMPCVRIARTMGGKVFAFDGIDCDWSQYKR